MRQFIGTVILFGLGLILTVNGSLFGLIMLAFGISALSFAIYPTKFGVPGFAAAMMAGTVALVALLVAGIPDFGDDCRGMP